MAIQKVEVIELANVTAVLLGSYWQAIEPGSLEEHTNGYSFVVAESGRKVFMASTSIAVRE